MIDETLLNELHEMIVKKLKGIAPDMDMKKIEVAIPDLIDSISSIEKIEENYFSERKQPPQA